MTSAEMHTANRFRIGPPYRDMRKPIAVRLRTLEPYDGFVYARARAIAAQLVPAAEIH